MGQRLRRVLVRLAVLAVVIVTVRTAGSSGLSTNLIDWAEETAVRQAVLVRERDYPNPTVDAWMHDGARALFDWVWQRSDAHERDSIRYFIELRDGEQEESRPHLGPDMAPDLPQSSAVVGVQRMQGGEQR